MKQYWSKYFAADTPTPRTLGVKRSAFNFSEHCHVGYKIKANHKCRWVQTSTFSEHDHSADQIKGNHKCCNTVANILPTEILPKTMGSKGQNSIFSIHCHVAYQI